MTGIEELRRARTKQAQRKRRVIYNNDGDDIWWLYMGGDRPANIKEFLAKRTTGVENTQVDTISYCSAEAFTDLKCSLATKPEFQDMWPHKSGWTRDQFLLEGRDHIELLTEFCRAHSIELWTSVRMNDTHDQWYKKHRTAFKNEHPERWLAAAPNLGGGSEEQMFFVSEGSLEHPERWVSRGSCGAYYGADYANQAVRDRMLLIVKSFCEEYDFDGVELDFLRGPLVFGNTAKGATDAGDENRNLMTDLIRRIRKTTEEVGLRRGRPFVIAIRVPDSPELASAYGLDTGVWLREGLVDILIAGESARIRPWKDLVEFGHGHNVPVYPCVIEIMGGEESIRGRALAAWAAGADGIYVFNHFKPLSPLWKELGDPKILAECDRTTPVFNANVVQIMGHISRLPGVGRFLAKPPRLPLELPDAETQILVFEGGEDGNKDANSKTPFANVCLRFDLMKEGDRVQVRLNGFIPVLQPDFPAAGWITCKDAASILKWGDNTLEIKADLGDKRTTDLPRLIDLEIRVTNQPQEPSQAAQDGEIAPKITGPLNPAFLLTEEAILPPNQPLTGLQQWLLDELLFARPRVPNVYKTLKENFHYEGYQSEEPLPGYRSLAILFDTAKMGQWFEKEMMFSFFHLVNSSRTKTQAGLYAGPLAGSHTLAGLVIRSQSEENLNYLAVCFGPDCQAKGILPLPIRFLRSQDDGHLIPRTFAVVLRGMLDKGSFQQDAGCWKENLIKPEELKGTTWKLT